MLINRDEFVSFDAAAQYFQRKMLLDFCRTLTVAQYQHEHLLNNKLLICYSYQIQNVKKIDML